MHEQLILLLLVASCSAKLHDDCAARVENGHPKQSTRRSLLQIHTKAANPTLVRSRAGDGNTSVIPYDDNRQVPPFTRPDSRTQIHCLISAFQDGLRCANTLFRAFAQAKHAVRLSFEVLQAVGIGDVQCFDLFAEKYVPELCESDKLNTTFIGTHSQCEAAVISKVRFSSIPLEEALGPAHQRGLLSERAALPKHEDSMCLSLDSHMDFTESWDDDLLADWFAADNEFAVLTTYPQSASQKSTAGKNTHAELCGYTLSHGIPRGVIATAFDDNRDNFTKPTLTMNWAAGQSFARCHAERNVPVDKGLRSIFDGEEVDRAVRLWTHGYDMYNPSVSVVLHDYDHPNQHFVQYFDLKGHIDTEARLKALLGGDQQVGGTGELDLQGLGPQRSLEDYVRWSHTDLGGRWSEFLKQKHITSITERWQPDGHAHSNVTFCRSLERPGVRDVKALVASARRTATA